MKSREQTSYKQMLVVRSDLEMGKGKIAVQCAHAAVSASEDAKRGFADWWGSWMSEGQAKIAVKVTGEEMVLDLARRCREARLPFYVVKDRGLTQVEPGTVTCIGIGPAPSSKIDVLTGDLALL